jgi:ADP-ribosylglycohydrolase
MSMALWRDVVAATVLTHRDEAAVAASAGFLGLLSECLAWSSGAPPGRWWPETFLRYAEPMEVEHAEYTARVPGDVFAGGLCARVEQTVLPAVDAGWAVLECTQRWHSGAYLLETVPCVLHILARHGADPEEAIIRAVNDTSDNDTIASVVGAAVGALHGAAALPSRWKESLLGRTFEADDGQVQALTERAIETFVL